MLPSSARSSPLVARAPSISTSARCSEAAFNRVTSAAPTSTSLVAVQPERSSARGDHGLALLIPFFIECGHFAVNVCTHGRGKTPHRRRNRYRLDHVQEDNAAAAPGLERDEKVKGALSIGTAVESHHEAAHCTRRLAHDEYRTRRVRGDAPRNAACEQASKRAVTAPAEDDDACLEALCFSENRVARRFG